MELGLAFLLGVVSGLRTFTAPAVLWIMRHGGLWAYVLAAGALFEYYLDVQPSAPPRTGAVGLIFRLLSGAFVGWWAAASTGISPAAGAAAGAIGAVAGAYGGLALRLRAAAKIGNVASGLLEDLVAIGAAVALVARL
jgi:uncharacterized membrane protein